MAFIPHGVPAPGGTCPGVIDGNPLVNLTGNAKMGGCTMAGKAGVTALIQPGGSVRDTEVIEMADAYNMAMVFTGVRHFRH